MWWILLSFTPLCGCTQGGGAGVPVPVLWKYLLEEYPAAPMETFSLQLYSSVLLNPASILTSGVHIW